jgi:hypothetical protein
MEDPLVFVPDVAPVGAAEEPAPPSPRCPACASTKTHLSLANVGLRHRLLWLGGGAIHVCRGCRRRFVACAVARRHPARLWNTPGVCVALALRGRREPLADDGDDDEGEPPPPSASAPPELEELGWLWVAGSTGSSLAGLGTALAALLAAGRAGPDVQPFALAALGVGLALTLAGALLAHLGHVDPDRDYRTLRFTRAESRIVGLAGVLAHALGVCVLAGLVLALAYAILAAAALWR